MDVTLGWAWPLAQSFPHVGPGPSEYPGPGHSPLQLKIISLPDLVHGCGFRSGLGPSGGLGPIIPKCNLRSFLCLTSFMDVILGWALDPVIPKRNLGSFHHLISLRDVTLGWALGLLGCPGPSHFQRAGCGFVRLWGLLKWKCRAGQCCKT
eukprot:7037180-Karenia_brevis.AAC.1